MADAIHDEDGLYYPYMHVRSEEWLKTNLLYFPHILRMVPPHFQTQDTPFVRSLMEVRGIRDQPLLGSYQLRSHEADEAINKLTERLISDVRSNPSFRNWFSRTTTQIEYRGQDSEFLIHRGKAPQRFWDELTQMGLMWTPSGNPHHLLSVPPTGPDPAEWAALHPALGEAFMATIATAAAKDWGLEVITDSPRVHEVMACRDEDLIYRTLIRDRHKPGLLRRSYDAIRGRRETPAVADKALQLAHLVIVNNFDVSSLTAQDLAAMSRNKEALFDFRQFLAERVTEIPAMESESRRQQYLKEAAEEVIDRWKANAPSFSKFAKRLFGIGFLDKSEKAMTDLAKAVVPASLAAAGTAAIVSSVTTAFVAAAPGLAVAMVVYGIKTWKDIKAEQKNDSLRYLSLLRKTGASLMIAAPPVADNDSDSATSAAAV